MSESKKTVFVVGLGPGGGQFLTVQAQSALQQAEVLCGYTVYIDLVAPPLSGKGVLHHRHDPGDRPLPLGAGHRPGGSGRGAWSAPATPGSTAWPARCWSWPKSTRMSMWRSSPA